jgi:hypothetical protein
MYISLTIFLFRSGIAFYFHLFSTVQVTVRQKKKYVCVYGHMSKKSNYLKKKKNLLLSCLCTGKIPPGFGALQLRIKL